MISSQPLEWIDQQHDRACDLVQRWASICTGSGHVEGIERFLQELKTEFAPLGGSIEHIALEPVQRGGVGEQIATGGALRICKRPECARRVFLGIHTDTVYGPDHPFQQCQWLDDQTLRGPGVSDAKGGLVVLLLALQAFEQSGAAAPVGWEVVLNPDEEIGSPASDSLFEEAGHRCGVGFLFEPTLEGGAMVSARKGSASYRIEVTGKSAHVGRDPFSGRNAIVQLARLVEPLHAFHHDNPRSFVNIATIEGGRALNVVPDQAACSVNLRAPDRQAVAAFEALLDRQCEAARQGGDFGVAVSGGLSTPPKPITEEAKALQGLVTQCGEQLGLAMTWQETGGVCDGNRLAAAGLPNVDTMGPRGGRLHSPDEYLITPSLVERAKLTALALMTWASGEGLDGSFR